jgi:hypothetical protein
MPTFCNFGITGHLSITLGSHGRSRLLRSLTSLIADFWGNEFEAGGKWKGSIEYKKPLKNKGLCVSWRKR